MPSDASLPSDTSQPRGIAWTSPPPPQPLTLEQLAELLDHVIEERPEDWWPGLRWALGGDDPEAVATLLAEIEQMDADCRGDWRTGRFYSAHATCRDLDRLLLAGPLMAAVVLRHPDFGRRELEALRNACVARRDRSSDPEKSSLVSLQEVLEHRIEIVATEPKPPVDPRLNGGSLN